MKLLLTMSTMLILIGCCPESQTIITDRTDTLYVPVYADSDTVTLTRIDSVWAGETVKYIIRVDTLIKRVYINRKADTITVFHTIRDTVQVIKEVKSDNYSLMDYLKFILVIMVVGFIITLFRK